MIKKRGAAALAVFAVLLTGCGGGGSDDTVVSANPPAPSPAPAPSQGSNNPPVANAPAPGVTLVRERVEGETISTTPVQDTAAVDPNPPPPVAPPPAGIPSGAELPRTNNNQGYFFLTSTESLYKWNTASGKWDMAAQQPPVAAAPPAPPKPAEPAPGTYVLGKVVKAAFASSPSDLGTCSTYQYYYYYYLQDCDTAAYESSNGVPDVTKQAVYVGNYLSTQTFSHYSYPQNYNYASGNPKYPQSSMDFAVVYPGGVFALGKTVTTYSNGQSKALVRDEDFVIKDDLKFILNTSAATWKGVEGDPYFLQLQVSTYAPSSTVFKVCMHQYFPGVRRLACTLHDKDSGDYKGTQVLDDSRQLGSTEYLPLNK